MAPLVSYCGGFQLNTQSQKAMGLGGSITGLALDGSVVFFNPAGISFLDSNYVNVGINLILPNTTFLGQYSKSEEMASQIYAPYYGYLTYKLKGKWSTGLSINNPFMLGAKWEDNWSGRYLVQEEKINTTFIQPTISYKINDHIAFGVGPAFVLSSFNFRKELPYSNINGSEASAELKGNTTGIGYNAGIFASYGKFTFGFDYRSKVKLDFKNADANFNNVPPSLILNNTIPNSTSFNTTINLPSVFSLGLGYKFTEKFLLNFDLNYTGWSVYDSIKLEYPDYPSLNNSSAKEYKSIVTIHLGAQYKSTEKLTLRAGIAIDQSPVKDGYLSPELPDASRFIVSGGITYRIKRHLYFEGTYMFESVKERKETSNLYNNFNGTYKTYLNHIGLGLQYNF